MDAGLVVMEAMGTLPCMAYCYPEEEEEHSIPDPDTSNGVSIHLVHLGRAFVTLNAQNAVWVGAYVRLCTLPPVWRELRARANPAGFVQHVSVRA